MKLIAENWFKTTLALFACSLGSLALAQDLTTTITVGQEKITATCLGVKGQAKTAPEVKLDNGAVIATVVENGNYQGVKLTLSQPIARDAVKSIALDFYQSVYPKRSGRAAVIVYYTNGNGMIGSLTFGKTPWTKCVIPLDQKFTAIGKNKVTGPLQINRVVITLYRNLKTQGQAIGFKNLQFVR